MRCELSPQAERDLREIGDYIARDNPARAERFIDELIAHGEAITRAPHAYATRDDISRGMRACVHQRYLLFFTVGDAVVRIERILHGARLISADDFELEA